MANSLIVGVECKRECCVCVDEFDVRYQFLMLSSTKSICVVRCWTTSCAKTEPQIGEKGVCSFLIISIFVGFKSINSEVACEIESNDGHVC